MGEGGKLSKATLPEQVYSLLFSDYFVSPVTDNLLFLNQQKATKECAACKRQSRVCLQIKGA